MAKLPITKDEQEKELETLLARGVELGLTDDARVAALREQIQSGKTNALVQVIQWRQQVKMSEKASRDKEERDAIAAEAANRVARSPIGVKVLAVSRCCLRLVLFTMTVATTGLLVAGLSLASLSSWENGGDVAGWMCSLGLLIFLPCLCGCIATYVAAVREWIDSPETLCPTLWFMLILGLGLGPMVAICYVAGPSLLQAATVSRGGTAYNVSATPATLTPQEEVSLIFQPGVHVDTSTIGVATDRFRAGGRYYTDFTCVAPIVSSGMASSPVLYWARDSSAIRDDEVGNFPRWGACFTPRDTPDIYNRSLGIRALSMGTHYYSRAWGRIDAADKLGNAKQDALQRYEMADASGSLYVTVVETLSGPGSAVAHFTTEAAGGILWAYLIPVLSASGLLALWVFAASLRRCDKRESDGKSVDCLAWMCPGIRGDAVPWSEYACIP